MREQEGKGKEDLWEQQMLSHTQDTLTSHPGNTWSGAWGNLCGPEPQKMYVKYGIQAVGLVAGSTVPVIPGE